MKKLFGILFMLAIVSMSCEKQKDEVLTVTGDWVFSVVMGTSKLPLHITLIQDGTKLTETDRKILSSSSVHDRVIVIDIDAKEGDILRFTGNVNSTFTGMSGLVYYVEGKISYEVGSWTAVKE